MKVCILTIAVYVGLTVPASIAYAEQKAEHTAIDQCIAEIQKQKPGEIIKLEKLHAAGKAVYEFEVKDSNRFEWEFMCNTAGKIIEQEGEVSGPSADAFKKSMKVSEQDAMAIALKAYPGKIEEIEYEIEENGKASYEFDIVTDKLETKIEVDAATGKIIEVSTEEWEIGEETEERR